ncbi:MAG: response regulator [Candidatus Krumholzibacteriota bacterium]|nr:response regulator [Candidatus Krumholzibacteriota bacterium]
MSKSILVVDDDPDVIEIISETLKNEGYLTESATDGDEALRKYDIFNPDLVILDVSLPSKDGFAVCDEIRSRDINNDVPVILISGNSVSDTMLEGFKSGAQDYIKKPFSLNEVLAKIGNFLEQADGRKNLREQKEILEDELHKGQEDYKRVNRKLKKIILDMRTLFDLSHDLNSLHDPEELYHVFFLTIIGQLGVESLGLFHIEDEEDDFLSFAGGKRVQEGVLKTIRLFRNTGLAKYLVDNSGVLELKSSGLSGDVAQEAVFMKNLGFEYCFPLIIKGKLIGLFFIGGKINKQAYTKNDFEIFKSICNSATTGIQNSRLYTELQNTYLSTIKVLVSTIEAKDANTRGHTDRVANYARLIADEMGIEKEQKDIISFGAALHDIGKLGVYENILNKPSELTEKEWKIVRSHPEVGANIIKNLKFLEKATDLVRHHHERLDGGGYPDGLKGDEISLGARIVSVADSFDAMTTNRPYREALSFPEAFEQLRMLDTKFDQDIVENLARLYDKKLIRE